MSVLHFPCPAQMAGWRTRPTRTMEMHFEPTICAAHRTETAGDRPPGAGMSRAAIRKARDQNLVAGSAPGNRDPWV